jgi:NADH dehydrogenase FAD-containing subunit
VRHPAAPLAQAAGVRLLEAARCGWTPARARCAWPTARTLGYDLLSLDTGSVMDRDRIPGAREHGLFVRPIEHFVRLLDPLLQLAPAVLDVVVVGGGAAGVELALALQHRLAGQGDERARVALVTGGPPPLFGYPQTVIERGLKVLARAASPSSRTLRAHRCRALHLDSGARLACDAPVIATGGDAPPYLAGSGLQLDERGFVLTGPTLQSLSHPEVLAAGDVATRSDAPHPRSGVHAVRAGPPLAANLRAPGGRWRAAAAPPQARTLNLLSCGDRRAIATWGGWSAQGRWVWWWKDRIDRAFIASLRGEPPAPAVYSCGRKTIVMAGGTRPSVSRGSVPVRSMARSTASSQSLLPLLRTMRRAMMLPLGPARTSTSAAGLPLMVSVNTMLGLMAAISRPV